MKQFLIGLLLTLGLCGVIRAEIPLVAEQTIQLPNRPFDRAWDVQHWMSDSTWGLACIRGDTILYVEQLGDPIQRFAIPDSLFDVPVPGADHIQVKLLRLSREPLHAFVLVQSEAELGDGANYIVKFLHVTLIDLTSGQIVGSIHMEGSRFDYEGMFLEDNQRSVGTIVPWPPPPQPSAILLIPYLVHDYWSNDAGGGTSSGDDVDGQILYSNLTVPGFSAGNLTEGSNVSPFGRVSQGRFALSVAHVHTEQFYDGGGNSYYSCWITTYSRDGSFAGNDTTHGCVTAIAQDDADGTERMLIQEMGTVRAVDPNTYADLWQNSTITGALYTALLDMSGDERLLSYHSQTRSFSVYDAASGAYLDETSPIIGDIDHIIKAPNQLAEFVTRDADNVVRVYRAGLATPSGLTCAYISESRLIHLNWNEVPGAVEYLVYSGPTPGSAEVLEASVSAPAHSLDLTPEDGRRFYFVTAEYASR